MALRRIKRVCVLAEALQPHVIKATFFEPFAVAALGSVSRAGTQTTDFMVTLENIGRNGIRTERLRIQWQGDTSPGTKSPMQPRDMTELAACGIACAILWHYTGLRVLAAAEYGQGFDYWVGDETEEQGLEISGTQADDINEMQERHREKRSQLLSTLPVGGYVIVVGFARREIIFSYHASEET